MVTFISTKRGSALFLQVCLVHILIAFSLQSLFFAPHAQAQVLSIQDFDALLQDLRNHQFFTGASILGFLSPPFLTNRITLMIPTDAAIASVVDRFSGITLQYPPIVQFHILVRNLSFKQLQLLPEGTWLPTMVPGKGIQVTNADPANFTLNNAKIVNGDICPSVSNAAIACQGIDSLFDMSSILAPEPQNPPFSPAPAAAPSTPPVVSPAPPPQPPPPPAPPAMPPAASPS